MLPIDGALLRNQVPSASEGNRHITNDEGAMLEEGLRMTLFIAGYGAGDCLRN
jgi:hypothetical protein